MSEHAFMVLMLALIALETAVVGALALYFGYRTHKSSQQTEGLIAATYLEAKKALTQQR